MVLPGMPRQVGGIVRADGFAADYYTGTTIAATQAVPVFTAPFRCRIVSASLVAFNAALAADDTNYWSIDVARYYSGGHHAIATKTTKVTGGEAFTQRVPWTFDSVTFSAAESTLNVGDIAEFVFTKVAAAANLPSPLMTLYYVKV